MISLQQDADGFDGDGDRQGAPLHPCHWSLDDRQLGAEKISSELISRAHTRTRRFSRKKKGG